MSKREAAGGHAIHWSVLAWATVMAATPAAAALSLPDSLGDERAVPAPDAAAEPAPAVLDTTVFWPQIAAWADSVRQAREARQRLLDDMDTALREGAGFFVAVEDTIPFAKGTVDTLLISAPRIKVGEVVRRIGERMAADRERMRDLAYTTVVKVIARQDEPRPGEPAGDWVEHDSATRVVVRGDDVVQTADLWSRERKYRNGALDKEEIEDEVKTDWREITEAAAGIPFSLEGADEYNYEILDRHLIGEHLIYMIRFTPKSRFKALPSGVIWMDYSDFVIRRMEGSMTGSVPVPLVIKSIPVFKLRRVPLGGFWLMDDLYAKILLHEALPGIPASIEIYLKMYDVVINGVAFPETRASASAAAADTVRQRAGAGQP